jgi:hypothetical protein
MAGGANSDSPIRRIFNALGSRLNPQHATMVQGGINLVKTAVSQSPLNSTKGRTFQVLTTEQLWRQSNTGDWLNPWMTTNSMSAALSDLANYGDFAGRLRNVSVSHLICFTTVY